MIKLIVSDIDGTLLQDGEKDISPVIFCEIHRLREKGLIFCPASGRQYNSLRGLFAPIADELTYLCDNGSILYGPGNPGPILSKTVMDRDAAIALSYDILADPQCEVLLSGANMDYLCSRDSALADRIRYFTGYNLTSIRRPEDVPEEIIKVSAYCRQGAAVFAPAIAPRWADRFFAAVAGQAWLDFNNATKGTGLQELCRVFSIAPDEVMAFGDNYNDLPMLDFAGHPYLMAGASAALRESHPFPLCRRVEDILQTL